jgi:hypothetical protein
MKSFFTRNKILVWLVIILLILNLSVIATVLYTTNKQAKQITLPAVTSRHPTPGQGIFLRTELDMTDEQFLQFNQARTTYQARARELNRQLTLFKKNYYDELMKSNPDQDIIRSSCDSIGARHVQLMQETGSYYLEIRKLCNNDQITRLNQFFSGVIQSDARPMMHERGMRAQPGRRGRNYRNNN